MAIAVLSTQDCLRDPISTRGGLLSTPPRAKIHHNPNPSSSSSSRHNRGGGQSIRRKRSPNSSPPPPQLADSPHAPTKTVVKILKRGEQIPIEKNPVPIESKKADLEKSSPMMNRSVDSTPDLDSSPLRLRARYLSLSSSRRLATLKPLPVCAGF
ncbi:hypothetical protein LINPERPRIM_LOCUS26245 [Linum perenne]